MRKWIGCDQKGCTYWEHATCSGSVLIPGKPASDHIFFCIIHKAWKSKGYLDKSFIVSFVYVNTVVLKGHSCKKRCRVKFRSYVSFAFVLHIMHSYIYTLYVNIFTDY